MRGMYISVILLSFGLSGCGNVSLSKSQLSSNTGTGNVPLAPPNTPTPVNAEPVLETEKLTTLIDEQIPTYETFFNNLDTFTNTLGTNIVVATSYRHGANAQNFEDKVQIQMISASGSVTNINLPQLSQYRWGWKAVNSVVPNICFLANSKDNGLDQLYYSVNCNGPIGFKNYILSLNPNSKILSVVMELNQFVYDMRFNQQDELIYLTNYYEASTSSFTYLLKKSPTGQTVASVNTNQLNGFNLSNAVLMQNANGEYIINLVKNVSGSNTYAFYSFSSNSLQEVSISRVAMDFLQDKDSKKIFYYNLGSQQLSSGLFNINLATSSETKLSEDGNYIYRYQSLGSGIITKYGMPYNTSDGKAWISYDEGKAFKEIINPPAQTNQIVRTTGKEMYLVGVNQYSNSRVVATLYRLKER